jgi:molybdopterin converting factor small subunit
MATTIGSLDVKLNLELQRLDAQIASANRKVANMGKRMNSDFAKAARGINTALNTIGIGIGIGALTSFGKAILDLGGQITDLSRQANISTDAFQALAAVGRDSGVTGDQIALSFVRLGATVQEAAEGTKTAVESLEKLGLTAAGLKALAPEQQFEALARRIQGATDKEQAFNAALEILGAKTAPKLREVLEKLGTEGFDKLKEGKRLEILTKEQVDLLDRAGDEIERLTALLKVAGAAAVTGVASKVRETANASFGALDQLRQYSERGGAVAPAAAGAALPAEPAEQAAAIAAAAAQEATMRAAETAAKLKQLAEAQATTRARILKQDIELQNQLAKSFGTVTGAVGEQDEALAEYIETITDTRGPLREWLDEEAKVAALIEAGRITREQGGRYLSDMQSPEGEPSARPLDKLTTDAQKFEQEMGRIFESVGDSAARSFADMVLSGENAFKSLADTVARSMLELFARLAIINPLMNMVLGGTSGFQALPTLFSVFGGGRAAGGDVSSGTTYWVGEEGPELFTPRTSGNIIPNHALNGGGYSEAVTINYNIQAGVSRSDLVPILRAHGEAVIADLRDRDRRRK